MKRETNPTTARVTRRTVMLGGVALGATISSPAIVRAQSKTIVTTSYGGIFEERYRRHVIEPFEKKTGAKIVIKYGSPTEWLTNAMVNRADPEIDLPTLSLPITMKAIQTKGVFMDLSTEKMPNVADIMPEFFDKFDRRAVGFNYVDAGIAYRTDMVEKPPVGWADLWDPRFKGQLLLPDISGGFVYEMIVIAAMLNGGNVNNLEPGYGALKKLKPNIVRWYKSQNEVSSAFERKEAAVALLGSFRTYTMKDGGLPVDFVIPKEGAPIGVLSFHVPVNARNRDLALEFVDFASSAGPQTGFGNEMQSGMCNGKVVLAPKIAARVASQSRIMSLDWKAIEPRMTQMAERFQREVVGGS